MTQSKSYVLGVSLFSSLSLISQRLSWVKGCVTYDGHPALNLPYPVCSVC